MTKQDKLDLEKRLFTNANEGVMALFQLSIISKKESKQLFDKLLKRLNKSK